MESQKNEKSKIPKTAEKPSLSENRNVSSFEPDNREELAENLAAAESSLEKPADQKLEK